MLWVRCTACGSTFGLRSDIVDGEVVTCSVCGKEFVVRLKGGFVRLEEYKDDVLADEYIEF